MRTLFWMLLPLTVVVGAYTEPVAAETVRRDGDDQRALAKTQHLLKQMSSERDALKSEIEKLKAEIDASNKKATRIKKNADAAAAALTKSKEENTQLSEQLRQAHQTIQQYDTDKRGLETLTTRQSKRIETCEANNAKLVGANRELLDKYKNKGVFDALFQREPVTGLKGVEIENVVEEYRDKIDALQVGTVQPPVLSSTQPVDESSSDGTTSR